MANKNLTLFQRLNQIVGRDGIKQKQQTVIQNNKYTLAPNELLKTTNKAEFEAAKLQAQQNKWLSQVWKSVGGSLTQNQLVNESTRIGSYMDFENMEFYPLISAAWDIMAEEATVLNNNGRMMNIYSDSKRVKQVLEDLFFNRLDLHTSLPMWTRNVCKYGDNFLLLNIDDKRGVLGGRQMPNFEMLRKEGDFLSQNLDEKNAETTFLWNGRNAEFKSWQIAHFRLLSDDRKLPYGTSIMEKARKIWKQLIMSEDAMLVYRITRAAERRVYKINVGNIDEADVQAYVDKIANEFKRKPIVDPQTGQMDLKYNQMGNDQDFFVPVRTDDAPNPIDTLPGADNLDKIADIEYLRDNLFTAIRVPKTFLGFEDAKGEGKNLSLQDIRFARTINRVQQTMLQELNKIAQIHLFLLGFEDDLANFTLTLNNPSTQAEMLKVEHMQIKTTLYKDLVSDAGNGFAPMSMTRAKRETFGWSDDEIKQDLLEQRMEKAASAELANTTAVIKHTGTFDTVDKIYGDIEKAREGVSSEGEEGGAESGGAGGGGGGFAGGGLGSEDLDFGEENADEGETGNEEEGAETAEAGAEQGTEAEATEANPDQLAENLKKKKELLINKLNKKTKKYSNIYESKLDSYLNKKIKPIIEENQKIHSHVINLMLEHEKTKETIDEVNIEDKNLRINDQVNDILTEFDKRIDDDGLDSNELLLE